jgi:hypothetical protein
MNRYYTTSFFTLALVVLFTVSCKKNETSPPPPTNTELLSQSSWTLLSATASGTDVTNNAALTCFKDNVITFAANGSFTINEGVNICSPSTAGSFTWSFQSSETQLVLSAPLIPGGSSTFTLVTLNSTNLIISQNVTIPPSPTAIPVVFTFKH